MPGQKHTLTDDAIKDILGSANIPLLMVDQHWLALFPREFKSERMIEYEKKVIELMKEEARIREKIRAASRKKTSSIDRINNLTTDAYVHNKKSAKADMHRYKVAVLRANSYFLQAERQLSAVEKNIQECNRVILEETIKIAHSVMSQSKEIIDELSPRIDKTREELKKLTMEISVHEQKYDNTYRLLNKLVGPEIIDKLDSAVPAEKKKWF